MPARKNGSGTSGNSGGTRRYDNTHRRWFHPGKRAAGYAAERKAKVHQRGPKEGQELSEYDKGVRSGYLLARSDEAGMYKYKKVRVEGKSKAEAKKISQTRGKKKEE